MSARDLDARFEALIQGYAAIIGDTAAQGDMAGLERARRFHQQVVKLRDHWREGSTSAVRQKREKAPVAAPAPAAAPPASGPAADPGGDA